MDDKGQIKKDSELERILTMGSDRDSIVGVKDGNVCKTWHDYEDNPLEKLGNFFLDMVGLYESCNGVDEKVASGAAYSFTDGQNEHLKLASGYMLYSEVRSLLEETDSATALARERYYAEHPKDESEAGVLARISGMEKWEAELALAYADYLTYIANYDASDRYAFGDLDLGLEKPILMEHNNMVMENLYAWHREEIEYKDTRNREVATA